MALSPMMQHYFEIKEKNPDCIIFYRLGDFYEMFFDDAIKASEILGLTLTGRDCGLPERAPMCGVPYHAVDAYLSKLVKAGEKVAICEQLTEPKKGELVNRDIVRIVTAGTLIEDNLIEETSNNYIACIKNDGDIYSVAWADITTGEFFVRTYIGPSAYEDLTDFLVKIVPAEIIADKDFAFTFNASAIVEHKVLPRACEVNEKYLIEGNAIYAITKQFNVEDLAVFGLANNSSAIISCGALLLYLYETQKHALTNITCIKRVDSEKYMNLTATTVKNLELLKSNRDNKTFGTLYWLLNKTVTNMGARILNNWILSPLLNKYDIMERLNSVDCFYQSTLLTESITSDLKSIKDIARITGKISNGNLTPRDCVSLNESLKIMPSIKMRIQGLNTSILKSIDNSIIDFKPITDLISNAIIDVETPQTVKDGGFIKVGFSEELDNYRSFNKNAKGIIASLEARERENTGIKTLRVGYNRVFGYYIEVTNSFKDKVPYNYIRKQTIANAERYITEELKEIEEKILTSEEKALKLELSIYDNIKRFLSDYITKLLAVSDSIGTLDVLVSLAKVAKKYGYVKPVIKDFGSELNVVAGRHPVVEAISKEKFVPNDTLLDSSENNMMIITGPNMAGKSTYMRQVALISIMAQIGSFVPAKSAELPLVDSVYTRVGASDNLVLDQSTFMVEMTEVSNILKCSTPNSLLILDEIGRGTSTYDGLSIAWAVIEYINKNIKAKTLFATHYHELTELEDKLKGVKNYKITVKEFNNTIVFLRKIVRGGANRSFGIEVALLAGVPTEVTLRAKTILKSLEKKDINYSSEINKSDTNEETSYSQVENIIKNTDLNNLTPLSAFNLLSDLKEMLDK